MILHNQRYYLIACNEKWKNLGHYRLDRITDIRLTDEPATPLRSLPGHENGIDYKEYATSLPYMFTDKPESIEFWRSRALSTRSSTGSARTRAYNRAAIS